MRVGKERGLDFTVGRMMCGERMRVSGIDNNLIKI